MGELSRTANAGKAGVHQARRSRNRLASKDDSRDDRLPVPRRSDFSRKTAPLRPHLTKPIPNPYGTLMKPRRPRVIVWAFVWQFR